MDERKIKEADFHNTRQRDRLMLSPAEFEHKYPNDGFYIITRKTKQVLHDWMKAHCGGKVILDFCCGRGETTLDMAQHGAAVFGIDIAEDEIESARQLADERGLSDKVKFLVMDAECLQFEDQMFDLIVCNGVLHHLNLEKAYHELARVLKPEGQVICIEALGYNPLINLYRRFTPQLRTAWEMEHILTLKEVHQARAFFREVTIDYYYLFSIGALLLRGTSMFKPVLSFLEIIDSVVLKIPFIRLLAWQMIFILSQPQHK